tara:strand:+ start:189 stop:290 length:102 start_codon:yes stop_codon:yes gene_type:complete
MGISPFGGGLRGRIKEEDGFNFTKSFAKKKKKR